MDLQDRLAVQDVVVLYAQLLDSGQQSRVPLEIFTEDATIDLGHAVLSGRAEISAFFTGFTDLLGTSHNVSNFLVEIEGDVARCQSHCLAWHWMRRPDRPGPAPIEPSDLLAIGGYQDRMRRQDGRWRIDRRVMLSFGTGLGLGSVAEGFDGLFRGMLGRRPDWP